MPYVEVWKAQDTNNDYLSVFLNNTYNCLPISIDLERLGVIRPNNEDLNFYDENFSLYDIQEINSFVADAERAIVAKKARKIGRFVLAPTYAQISRNEYSEFRGDVYDDEMRSLEGFSAFRVSQQDGELSFPAIDKKFIFLIHTDDTLLDN